MSKLLILVRHAEAIERAAGDSDKSRDLTNRGITQAHQIGQFISDKGYTPDGIFSSTAIRAEQTATIIADALKLPEQRLRLDDELYDASVRTFFQFVCGIDDEFNSVICVGHNPAISYLGEYLTKKPIGDMHPSAATIIKFDIRAWKEVSEGNGELILYVDPITLANV